MCRLPRSSIQNIAPKANRLHAMPPLATRTSFIFHLPTHQERWAPENDASPNDEATSVGPTNLEQLHNPFACHSKPLDHAERRYSEQCRTAVTASSFENCSSTVNGRLQKTFPRKTRAEYTRTSSPTELGTSATRATSAHATSNTFMIGGTRHRDRFPSEYSLLELMVMTWSSIMSKLRRSPRSRKRATASETS